MGIQNDRRQLENMAILNEVPTSTSTFEINMPLQLDSSLTLKTKLFYESLATGIIAKAGGGQSSATVLSAEVNVISTVATAGDSVALPASSGFPSGTSPTLYVVNTAANSVQVYGTSTDTIDGAAAATGVSQMPNSVVLYTYRGSGAWGTEGLATGFGGPGLQTLSTNGGITAFAGGGQGSAVPLTAMINVVSTVATAGDSVALPTSAAGLMVTVINTAAKSCQVYGAGTDTINGVATATGVAQVGGSAVTYTCTAAGTWVTNGISQGYFGIYPTDTAANALTAKAGGGQGSATALPAIFNRVTTVGTAADSVLLPATTGLAAGAGFTLYVANAAASNSMNVFPSTGDQINALGANTAFAVAAGKTATFICTVAGQWHAILSA